MGINKQGSQILVSKGLLISVSGVRAKPVSGVRAKPVSRGNPKSVQTKLGKQTVHTNSLLN